MPVISIKKYRLFVLLAFIMLGICIPKYAFALDKCANNQPPGTSINMNALSGLTNINMNIVQTDKGDACEFQTSITSNYKEFWAKKEYKETVFGKELWNAKVLYVKYVPYKSVFSIKGAKYNKTYNNRCTGALCLQAYDLIEKSTNAGDTYLFDGKVIYNKTSLSCYTCHVVWCSKGDMETDIANLGSFSVSKLEYKTCSTTTTPASTTPTDTTSGTTPTDTATNNTPTGTTGNTPSSTTGNTPTGTTGNTSTETTASNPASSTGTGSSGQFNFNNITGLESPIPYYGPATSQELTNNVVTAMSKIAGALMIIVLLYGGILYITSAGNEEGIKKAQGAIKFAIIGIIVVLMAYFIIEFVVNLFY